MSASIRKRKSSTTEATQAKSQPASRAAQSTDAKEVSPARFLALLWGIPSALIVLAVVLKLVRG